MNILLSHQRMLQLLLLRRSHAQTLLVIVPLSLNKKQGERTRDGEKLPNHGRSINKRTDFVLSYFMLNLSGVLNLPAAVYLHALFIQARARD